MEKIDIIDIKKEIRVTTEMNHNMTTGIILKHSRAV